MFFKIWWNGDLKEEFKIIGEEMKNIVKSAYGRTSMNKSKHTATSYETLKGAGYKIITPYMVKSLKLVWKSK